MTRGFSQSEGLAKEYGFKLMPHGGRRIGKPGTPSCPLGCEIGSYGCQKPRLRKSKEGYSRGIFLGGTAPFLLKGIESVDCCVRLGEKQIKGPGKLPPGLRAGHLVGCQVHRHLLSGLTRTSDYGCSQGNHLVRGSRIT